MVLVLMEDRRKITNTYVEEVKKSNELTRLLREEKSKVRTLGVGLEEESKRSLAMEAELERHLVQINSQAEELQASRISTKGIVSFCSKGGEQTMPYSESNWLNSHMREYGELG